MSRREPPQCDSSSPKPPSRPDPHLTADGVAYSTTGEENRLPQPDLGLHHHCSHRCRLRYVSGVYSQIERRSLSQIHRLFISQHERTKSYPKDAAFVLLFSCF